MPRPPPPALDRFFLGLDDSIAARSDRDTGFAGAGARGIFVTHRVHRAGRRPNELDLAALADFREVRVLGQETVPGMDRIHVAHFGGAHDPVDLQITFRAGRRADTNRFVGQLDMERIDVGFGIDGESPDPQLLAGPDDAERDFAPIRDKNFLEH
jgi:hypothetical protein